jgi:EpsI family protein
MKSIHFWLVFCLLFAAAVVVRVRGDVDRVPVSRPLDELPHNLLGLEATDIPLEPNVLEVLGKGEFLNRMYGAGTIKAGSPTAKDASAPVGLFIGYFPTQRTGQAIHSPQHCLPGAGWVFETSGLTTLRSPGGDIQVGEYIISNGPTRDEVLYWYRSHGRSVASDYKAKLYTLADSIRYSRTDAALVRIVTPIQANETPADAHRRAVAFGEQLNPLLPAYIPD